MTHRERALTALNLGTPDYVPTFELEYQLGPEVFGKDFLYDYQLKGLSQAEIDRALEENAEFMIEVYTALGHSIIPIQYLSEEHTIATAKLINRKTNNEFLLTAHGDGTYAIPDGNGLQELIYLLYDDPSEGHRRAKKSAEWAKEHDKKLIDAGVESLILCSDYCFNTGPFLSPTMFGEFVQPYLYDIIDTIRKAGGYAIKHTDGNIMPILDMLIDCKPHALHSLDPMAGVDIREVKKITAGKLALCGNVHCAHLQTGTEEQLLESCRYAMEHGKPGGGFIFCTSNIPFRGMPVDRYEFVLKFWRENRYY